MFSLHFDDISGKKFIDFVDVISNEADSFSLLDNNLIWVWESREDGWKGRHIDKSTENSDNEGTDKAVCSDRTWPLCNESHEHKDILEKLAPYHTKTFFAKVWVDRDVPEKIPEGIPLNVKNYMSNIKVYLYNLTPESKKILLTYYDSLFHKKSEPHGWKKPEDICFYKENSILLGSVSHERECFLYAEQIKLPGKWEKCKMREHDRRFVEHMHNILSNQS